MLIGVAVPPLKRKPVLSSSSPSAGWFWAAAQVPPELQVTLMGEAALPASVSPLAVPEATPVSPMLFQNCWRALMVYADAPDPMVTELGPAASVGLRLHGGTEGFPW